MFQMGITVLVSIVEKKDICMKDDCPHQAEHVEKGWIVIDGWGRPTQPDGKMIPFSGGPTAKL